MSENFFGEIDLSEFDEEFGTVASEPIEDSFSPVPDGEYVVKIDEIRPHIAKTGTKLLKWKLRIVGPTYAGRVLFRNNVFGKSQFLGWMRQDIGKAGFVMKSIAELPVAVDAITGTFVEVKVKNKPSKNGHENQEVYIIRPIPAEEVQEADSYGPADDEIPF